jgi:addiction module HigA family antidote
MPKKRDRMMPEHPGKLLKEEMDERGLSIQRLAQDLRVPATRIHAIVHGRRGITADTSARLGRYLGVSSGYWLRLQGDYDMRVIDSAVIEREVLLPEAS